MKIPGAHPQMVSNKLQINFQKNPCTYFLDHACTKPCPQMGYREREIDGQAETNILSFGRRGGG